MTVKRMDNVGIVVDGVSYRWRFGDVLVVIPVDCSVPQLDVDWGWRDWLQPDGPWRAGH